MKLGSITRMGTMTLLVTLAAMATTPLGQAATQPAASAPASADWPHWRGPNDNGIVADTNWTHKWPAEGPKVLWKAQVGTGFSSITISGGRAFTMGNTNDVDTVWCFAAATGKELWKQSYPCKLSPTEFEGGPCATPTVEGNRVYTFSRDGQLFCWEAATGKQVWALEVQKDPGVKRPNWGFPCSPVIEGDRLILNAGTCGLAVDKNTGKAVWTTGKEPAGYSTPVLFNIGAKRCAAMFGFRHFAIVDVADGKIVWKTPWQTQYDVQCADPVVADGKLFFSTAYDKGGRLVDLTDGKFTTIWENQNMRNHFMYCILWQGCVYGFDEYSFVQDQFRCVDFKTGELKWTQKGLGVGGLIMADGKLIILAEGNLVVAQASSEKFVELARAKVLEGKTWTPPTLAGGRLYARNAKGDVVCLDVSAGKP